MRHAPSKGICTRSRAAIVELKNQITHSCRVYNRAQAAMVHLGADTPILIKFHILVQEDVRASTAIIDPNISGSSTVRLSWIWETWASGLGAGADTLVECEFCSWLIGCAKYITLLFCYLVQGVHWLCARAQRSRWSEELILVGYEMMWTARYFWNQADLWRSRVV